MAKPYTRLG